MTIKINELIIRANIVQNKTQDTTSQKNSGDKFELKKPTWPILQKQKEKERER